VRRVVELTGLGIAATYFLDARRGAERRRAAWGLIAGTRGGHVQELQPAAALATDPVPAPAEPSDDRSPAPPELPEELVLLSSEQLSSSALPKAEGYWPSWGWALVLTITICAIAAFAAVGLGIWAIEHRTTTTTTRTVTTQLTGAAPMLADPTARRIIGTAIQGSVILRLDSTGAALAVAGLPALPRASRYRVWIATAGAPTAAGGFAGRSAVLVLKPLDPGSRVTITREPAEGPSDAPHGPQVATLSVQP
jgi:Anti-sigma-K factor rskA